MSLSITVNMDARQPSTQCKVRAARGGNRGRWSEIARRGLDVADHTAHLIRSVEAREQDRSSEQSGGWVLGVFYFEQLCRLSIGNPKEFHRLVESSDLKRLADDEYQKVKSPEGLEGWERREGGVRVMVEYT